MKNQFGKMGFGVFFLCLVLNSCENERRSPRHQEATEEQAESTYSPPQRKSYQQVSYPNQMRSVPYSQQESYPVSYPNQTGSVGYSQQESYPGANRDLQALQSMESSLYSEYLSDDDPPYIREMRLRCQQGDVNACNVVNNYRYQMAAQYDHAIQRMENFRR